MKNREKLVKLLYKSVCMEWENPYKFTLFPRFIIEILGQFKFIFNNTL